MRMRRRQSPLVRLLSPLRDFLHAEAAGGILLVAAAVIAVAWANSPWSDSYRSLWDSQVGLTVAGHTLSLSLRLWLNDALMALFFLVVGLEIRREVTSGHLASRRAAALPALAALGGMAVPALLYLAIAGGSAPRGWGVPMATDIALAVGVLALVGDRASGSTRAFLLGLAIVDDIGAIIVIAAFYSTGVTWGWLLAGAGAIAAVVAVRAAGVQWSGIYWILGAICWLAFHEAGVHPTLAGVAMGLLAPVTPHLPSNLVDAEELSASLADVGSAEAAVETGRLARSSVSVVEWLLHVLHPWTSYLIVPLFAMANAGIEINRHIVSEAAGSALAWGIFAGLVVGKPLGVTAAARLAARSGVAEGITGTRRQLMGVGAAAGIGFTVALFVAELAFDDPTHLAEAKLSILVASAVSAGLAAVTLMWQPRSSRTR